MKEQILKYLRVLASDNYGKVSDVEVAQEISELDFWQPIETAPKDGTWIQGWGGWKISRIDYVL